MHTDRHRWKGRKAYLVPSTWYLAVDLAAVADSEDFDDAPSIIHLVNDAVVALPDPEDVRVTQLRAPRRAGSVRQKLNAARDAILVGFGKKAEVLLGGRPSDDLVAAGHKL